MIQDYAGTVTAGNCDRSLRSSPVEGKRHRIKTVLLASPLRCQPARQLLQAGLRRINRDSMSEAIGINGDRRCLRMGSATR